MPYRQLTRLLAPLLTVLIGLASCSYESSLSGLSCDEEGARSGGRVCQDGVWRVDGDASLDTGPTDADDTSPGPPDAADAADTATADTSPGDIGADTDACVPESPQAFCTRQAAQCATLSGTDNCGNAVEYDCGECVFPNECQDNACVCPGETDAEFCTRVGADCGRVTAEDLCGVEKTVDCGGCAGGAACGAGGTPNVCGCPCNIGGTCYPDGTPNPNNPCQICSPSDSTTDWTDKSDGASCDDGDACTVSDACSGGVCEGSAKDCSHLDTQCITGVCNPANGACEADPNLGQSCDDGFGCTGDGACQNDGSCALGQLDNNKCLIGRTCYSDNDANPSNPCQKCDKDVDQTAWSANDGGTCDNGDGLSCTGICAGGSCSGAVHDGKCAIGGTCYSDNDANPANECEYCDKDADQTVWTVNEGGSCDDGIACTGDGTCRSDATCQRGQVSGGKCYIGGTCYSDNDPNPQDQCEWCKHSDDPTGWTIAQGESCDDGNACTSAICDAGGACVFDAINGGTCYIDNTCYARSETNPNNPCEICAPGTSQDAWTPGNEGTACYTGGPCTCQSGTCTHNNGSTCMP